MATTPTPTPTPTTQTILCGQGFTTGSFYYTDCCGNFVQGNSINVLVSLDYTKPDNGITRMNVEATTSCPTPTQTPTPTNTPTTTNTPSVTRTQTPTPTTTVSQSPTPSNVGAYNLKNECDVFTLFDMGIKCQVIKLPSSNTTFDGVLTMRVTGGTAPYSYYWGGGQRTQTLRNIPPGNYPITVVDYYGDYTANTICSIFAATPTPTPTTTTTPTVTPSSVWPNLCLIVNYSTISYGPFQFVISGSQNGRPQWTSGNMTLGWSTRNSRWEIQGWTSSTGLPVSTNSTNIPTSSWAIAGGTGTQPQISMTEGACPPYLPLLTNVVGTNTSCSGTLNCNGSISITTSGGIPPYIYSINNGISYQSSNVFNGLCQGTYTVIINDSTGNTQTQVVVIGFDNAPTTYTISAAVDRIETIGATTQIAYWHVDIVPAITDGSVVSFDLNVSVNKEYNQPGTGDISDTIVVMSNSSQVYPSSTSSITSTTARPYCSPYETINVSNTQTYQLQINAETSVSGTSTSILNVTNGAVGSNGCITTLQQSILTAVNSAVIDGNTCSTIVDNETPQGITNHTLQYGGVVDNGGGPTVNNYSIVGCVNGQTYIVGTTAGTPTLTKNKVYQFIGPDDGPTSFNGVNCWKVLEITQVDAQYNVATNGYEYADCSFCNIASVSVYSATTLQGISYACAETSGQKTVYYQGNLSQLGTILYQDSSLVNPVDRGYYNDWADSKVFRVALTQEYNEEGNIVEITTCPPPISYSSFQAFIGFVDCTGGKITTNGSFNYTNCSGTIISGGAEIDSDICLVPNQSHSSNIQITGPSVDCVPITVACTAKEMGDSKTLYKVSTETLDVGAVVYVDDAGTPVSNAMTMLVGGGNNSTRYQVSSSGVITSRTIGYRCT